MSSSDELVTKQKDEITVEELEQYQRWEAPHVVSVEDVKAKPHEYLSVEAIEGLQKQAQQEGHKAGFEQGQKAGYQAGFDQGKEDLAQQLQTLRQIISTLNTPLENLDEELERDIVALVSTVARQVIRREIKVEPEHVIGAVRAALEALPINDRKIKIYIHPQDIDLVKKGLSMEDEENSWRWIEDPVLTRGGCRVETANTLIDATVEARLESVVNKLLGGERTDD